MTMITPSYLGETIEYSSLHACRSTLEDPTALFNLCAPVWSRSSRLSQIWAPGYASPRRRAWVTGVGRPA